MNSLENILSHQIVQKLGWTLLHFIWQATAAAILLAFLLRIMRRFSASLRYVAACLTLGLIVLLPVVTLQLINVPPQPSIVKIEPEPAPAPIIAPIQTTEEITIAESIEYAEPVRREPARLNYFAALKQKTADTLEPALQYIVTGWLLGVFALSIWHLGGWTQLQRLRRKLVKQVDTSLKTRLNQLSEKLGVNHAVELLESAIVQIPTVVGWIKPVILLPAGALTGLNTEQLEAILAHELAHIKRFDYLINMLQTVVEILGFYHPAVWWVSHKIREERENCCDDLAVTITGDRVRYAKALTLMEEIRGGKSELAVAATGGNLFSRIRRLVGKDSSEKSFSWIPAATVVLLLIALAIPTTVALTSNSNEAPDQTAIEKMLIDGFRENRDKFERGVLAWTLTDKNEGLAGKPKTETKGSFQLWWDGKKIATRFSQERMDLDAGVVIDRRSGGNVYDGGLLSRKPKFETFEDWFGQIIHWTGPRSMDQEIPALKKRENIALDFSKTIVDGRELAKFVSRNTDESDVSFRSYIVKYFDPSKSYGLINEEWYTGENKLYLKHTFTLREVIPGGWFPVEVDLKAFSLKDSTVYVDRQLALDLKRCSFNDPAAIPEGIFKFSTVKEQEQLNKILEKCSKGTMINTDIVENVRIRNACESVENYIAAALAGENEKAAEYAVPGSAVAQQTDDTRQVFQGQAAQILAVSSDDWNAMAISSVIQADRGRTGTVVFYLKKEILEQKVHWLIDDIDIETLDSIEAEIGRFLERNPGAILALFRPQRPVITPTNSAGEQSDTQVREETKISELLDKLEDEKYAHTRSEIIPLIEEIGDKEPASFLAGQLLADSRKRRCNAALVLELLGDRRGVPAIINELKDTSFRTTTRIRSDGTLYQDGQVTEDHYYAALLLGILGDERAVSSLIEATRDEKIDYQAAISLGQIGDKSAVPVLREMLKRCSDNPFSRLFAGYGLAMLNDKEGLKVVIDTLNEHQEDWTIRRHAIEALGKLGDKEATPYLIAALKDEHPNIKVSVAKALGEIGDVTALPALEQALEDKTVTKVNAPTSVSEIAAEAISQIQSWGEAVEDAQIRLLNAAQIWGQADWPHSVVRLRLDARNRGPRYLHLPENGLNWQIQVDGIWYEWVGFFNATTSDRETIVSSRGGRLFDFNPHDSHTDLKVDIGIGWRKIPNGKEIEFGRRRYSGGWPVIDNNEYGPELILQSGTHRLRVAIICPPSRAGYYEPVRLISNPVEIEILPGENTADSQVEREENRILSIDLQTENNQR
ncbi:MAG: HEAT repeat domain-containing protein, partial [Sedimentisphaerales bacterium]|nr:HEAT repeat domain-containing protein [Sedimentisphaerales bacterium]